MSGRDRVKFERILGKGGEGVCQIKEETKISRVSMKKIGKFPTGSHEN